MSATGARPGGRPGPKHGPFSLIGGDVSISGNITATVDLHIDGHVEGDIRCAALVQGPDSRIHGHVMARSARLAGLVDGSITAEELIVEATAQVTGDISYERITIEPGARIEGRFAHQNGEAAATGLKLIANENAA